MIPWVPGGSSQDSDERGALLSVSPEEVKGLAGAAISSESQDLMQQLAHIFKNTVIGIFPFY